VRQSRAGVPNPAWAPSIGSSPGRGIVHLHNLAGRPSCRSPKTMASRWLRLRSQGARGGSRLRI